PPRRPGTAPATAPGSTAKGSSSPAPPRRTSLGSSPLPHNSKEETLRLQPLFRRLRTAEGRLFDTLRGPAELDRRDLSVSKNSLQKQKAAQHRGSSRRQSPPRIQSNAPHSLAAQGVRPAKRGLSHCGAV